MASRVESSGVSVASEDRVSVIKKCHEDQEDDPESVYNTKTRSAYAGTHRKKPHPLLLGPSRCRESGKHVPLHAASKNNLSEFTQRIMSAKLLRVKQVQNQLSETQIQLNELINENRILRNLQKRQEGALRKYEGNHAQLPQLIRSHNEEIRTLKASNKLIKAQLKESNIKLKERENELESLRENYNRLKKLSSEKNLLEREKLQKKVEELQEVVKEQDEKIQLLSRKILLESKNYRHHMNIEMNKHKETQKDLSNALSMISRLENQLMVKEKSNWIPNNFSKLPLKREPKNLMPSISHKSLELRSTVGNCDSLLRGEDGGKHKNDVSESPETDFELLNGLVSSDDTPSPTQDIFPEITSSNKVSPEVKVSKSNGPINESPRKQGGALKSRTANAMRKSSKASGDAESDAKEIVDKITQNIENMDSLVQKYDLKEASSKARLNSLYEELKSNVSKIEEQIMDKPGEEREDSEKTEEGESSGGPRRNVSKRKLNEGKTNDKLAGEAREDCGELSLVHQQKYLSMTKAWNEIKEKVQEERMKAEQKMKELGVFGKNEGDDDSSNSGRWEEDKDFGGRSTTTVHDNAAIHREVRKGFGHGNFANDDFIVNELQKTDKAFKRLKNDKLKDGIKPRGKGTGSEAKNSQENASYRTESRMTPKCLDEFQSEYQKQNLLRALKEIDVGKDENSSGEEPEGCPRRDSGIKDETRAKMAPPFTSAKEAKNDLISELFGSDSKKVGGAERVGLDHRILEGIKARNN